MINYRGIIIESSISTETVNKLKPYIIRTYYHLLDKKYDTNIIIAAVPENELENILSAIKNSILNSYYAHFIHRDVMYVVFRGEICKITRHDTNSIEFCKSRGKKHYISDNLMKFEYMFEKDHPNE